jgi:hypothetical protein
LTHGLGASKIIKKFWESCVFFMKLIYNVYVTVLRALALPVLTYFRTIFEPGTPLNTNVFIPGLPNNWNYKL